MSQRVATRMAEYNLSLQETNISEKKNKVPIFKSVTPDKVNPMFKIHLFECAHLKCVLLLPVYILRLYYTTMIDIMLFPDSFLATRCFIARVSILLHTSVFCICSTHDIS